MKHLLQPNERNAIEVHYRNSLPFQLLNTTINRLRETSCCLLSPEQVFYECVDILDTISSKTQQDAVFYIKSLWSNLYMWCMDVAPDCNKRTCEDTTATLLYVVTIALQLTDGAKYRGFAVTLCQTLTSHLCEENLSSIRNVLASEEVCHHTQSLRQIITQYMRSEHCISDEIYDMLETLDTTTAKSQFAYLREGYNDDFIRDFEDNLRDACKQGGKATASFLEAKRSSYILKDSILSDTHQNIFNALQPYGISCKYQAFNNAMNNYFNQQKSKTK